MRAMGKGDNMSFNNFALGKPTNPDYHLWVWKEEPKTLICAYCGKTIELGKRSPIAERYGCEKNPAVLQKGNDIAFPEKQSSDCSKC